MKYYLLSLMLAACAPTWPMFQLADRESLQNRFKDNEKYFNFVKENKISERLSNKAVMPVNVRFMVDTYAFKHNVITSEKDELSRRDMDQIAEIILHDAITVPAKL